MPSRLLRPPLQLHLQTTGSEPSVEIEAIEAAVAAVGEAMDSEVYVHALPLIATS